VIAVIDYKAGNLTSVVKALHYLEASEVTVTQDPAIVRSAAKIVLPGVGHFQATQLLTDLGLTEAVRESVARGAWFLGICVGLQWLFKGSTEAPATTGLGHFPGACERFPAHFEGAELKSPHVGWNSLEGIRDDSRLLKGVNDDPEVMKLLMQRLLVARVRPYYIYMCDQVAGAEHFRTTVEKGLEIIKALRGWTSGLAVPHFVIDAPGGGGKIPLLPEYVVKLTDKEVVLKNYAGNIYRYAQPLEPILVG